MNEREQFESWAGGRYQSLSTVSAWEAWQARAALSQEQPLPASTDKIYAAWRAAGIDIAGGNWNLFVKHLTPPQASPATVAQVMTPAEALDFVDDFIARCNGDDRGSCEPVNVLRAALATAQPATVAQEELARRVFEICQGWASSTFGWASNEEGAYERAEKEHYEECIRRIVAALATAQPAHQEAQWVDSPGKAARDHKDFLTATAQPAPQDAQPVTNLQTRARQLGEDWHEGVAQADKDAWCNRAAGLLLHFAAPQPARAGVVELSDGRIHDLAEDFKSQYMHGGTTFDEFDYHGFARAIIAAMSATTGEKGNGNG